MHFTLLRHDKAIGSYSSWTTCIRAAVDRDLAGHRLRDEDGHRCIDIGQWDGIRTPVTAPGVRVELQGGVR